jgi:NADH:ubiquinone oxidoreductase subunit E
MRPKTDNRQQVEAESRVILPEPIVRYIEECSARPHSESQLISVLHKVQGHFGYLGREQMDAVAQLMQIPTAKVTGVATFYHFFRLQPRGRYVINVCMGTACYVKGADRVAERLKEELGIDFGETTKDGLFTLESTRCLGTCGLAPVIVIDEQVQGEVTTDQIPGILEKAIREARS